MGFPKKANKALITGEVLSEDQLQRLARHKYSASGVSAVEPYLQPFWRWLVEQIPLWWAPNALTLAGLVINGLTTVILLAYSPDGLQHVSAQFLVLQNFLSNATVTGQPTVR